jgi:uncharacterized OB-fold protein
MRREPFDASILSLEAGAVRLRGSACEGCGAKLFPRRERCPKCGVETAPVDLASCGTVYSYVVGHEPHPLFEDYPLPRVAAQVDLDDGVRVLGLLRSGEPAIGARCRLAPMEVSIDGRAWIAYCFLTEES